MTRTTRLIAPLFVASLILLANTSMAQMTQPSKRAKPAPSARRLIISRQLPPSMQAEIAKEQGLVTRKIIYRDTLKSSVLRSRLSRDTTADSDSLLQLAQDSAQSVVDSLVSEPHKAHLDSMILELPEFTGTFERPHFEYPLSIMTDPYRVPVKFDSTILSQMNPITREQLPYFDQHPIPLPIAPRATHSGWLEAGIGIPKVPSLGMSYSASLSDRWFLDVGANFLHNTSANPLGLLWSINAAATTGLSRDPAPDQNATLRLAFTTSGRQVTISSDSLGAAFPSDYLLLKHTLAATLAGGFDATGGYTASAGFSLLSDNSPTALSEDHEWIHVTGNKDFGRTDFGATAMFGLDHAGAESTPLNSTPSLTPSGLLAENFSARLTNHGTSGIEWSAGLSLFGGSDVESSSTLRVSPAATIKVRLTPEWQVGASFLPQAHMIDHAALSEIDPFWSPGSANQALQKDSATATGTGWRSSAFDPRRVAFDNINLAGFMSYGFSADDEIRAEIHIVDRDKDVIFYEHSIDSSHSDFYTLSGETRSFSASIHANLLLFTKDNLTASIAYSSATVVGSDAGVPFEPTLKVHAAYQFRTLIAHVIPAIEFDNVSRSARGISLLGISGTVELGPRSAILLRLENLLGGPSDYWTGYQETPRSVWAAFRYSF